MITSQIHDFKKDAHVVLSNTYKISNLFLEFFTEDSGPDVVIVAEAIDSGRHRSFVGKEPVIIFIVK